MEHKPRDVTHISRAEEERLVAHKSTAQMSEERREERRAADKSVAVSMPLPC